MTIVREYVNTIRERWLCECGGELSFTGRQKLTAPPLNEHECSECKKTDWKRGETYPRISYEPIQLSGAIR